MIGLNRKRFWKEVSVEPGPEGFAVSLDQRQLKTPAKSPLILPNEGLALAVAKEWRAIEKEINPAEMPHTRAANAAIDKVAPQFEEVAVMLAEYGKLSLAGNSLFLDYVLRIPYGDGTLDLRIDDRMYLVNPDTLINESRMLKFGFQVGEILLVIERRS